MPECSRYPRRGNPGSSTIARVYPQRFDYKCRHIASLVGRGTGQLNYEPDGVDCAKKPSRADLVTNRRYRLTRLFRPAGRGFGGFAPASGSTVRSKSFAPSCLANRSSMTIPTLAWPRSRRATKEASAAVRPANSSIVNPFATRSRLRFQPTSFFASIRGGQQFADYQYRVHIHYIKRTGAAPACTEWDTNR